LQGFFYKKKNEFQKNAYICIRVLEIPTGFYFTRKIQKYVLFLFIGRVHIPTFLKKEKRDIHLFFPFSKT